MINEKIHLKNYFSDILDKETDPVVELFLQHNTSEVNRGGQKRPAMIICPGGGYSFCSERESEPIALQFLSEGYNAFIINYSTEPFAFPTQLREIAALMELIYQNQDEWNVDVNKIIIIGFSAGGHLAAHYANAYNCPEVREVFPDSKGVNGCILCYPVISSDENYWHKSSFENLIGKKDPTQDELERFSINKLVTKDTPPTFIWHTAEDNAVPVGNSILYASVLSKNNVPFELHIYPYGAHGLSTSDAQVLECERSKMECNMYNHNWLEQAKRWLKLMNFTNK